MDEDDMILKFAPWRLLESSLTGASHDRFGGPGELADVFGGLRVGQESRKSTKQFTCQRFGAPQEPRVPQDRSDMSPSRLWGMPLDTEYHYHWHFCVAPECYYYFSWKFI